MRFPVALLAAAATCLLVAEEAACQSRKNQVVPYAVDVLGFDARGLRVQQRGGGDEEHVAFDDIVAFRTKNGKLQLRLAEGTLLATSLAAGELDLPDEAPWQELPHRGPQTQQPSQLRHRHHAPGVTQVFTPAVPLALAAGQKTPHTLQFVLEYAGGDQPPRDAAEHTWYLDITAPRGTYDGAAGQGEAGATAAFVLRLTADGQPIQMGGDLNPAVPSQIRFRCSAGTIKRIASAKTVEGKFRATAFRLASAHVSAAAELAAYAEAAAAAGQ
jgi:hypothetical protein